MNFHSIIFKLQLQFWFVCSFVCLFVCLVWGLKLAPNFYKKKPKKPKKTRKQKTGNKKFSTFKLKLREHVEAIVLAGKFMAALFQFSVIAGPAHIVLLSVSQRVSCVLRPQSSVSCVSCPVLGAIKFHFIKQ